MQTKYSSVIFFLSMFTSVFLLFIYLNSEIFKIDFVLIGVVQEMLTIPSILVQPILFFLLLRIFYKEGYKIGRSFYMMLLPFITMVLTWGSLLVVAIF